MLVPCPPIILSIKEPADALLIHKSTLFVAELTTRCNLSCSHCYSSSRPDIIQSNFMTPEYWRKTFRWAQSKKYEQLQFIGGEATIHPDFVELLQYACDLGFDVEVFSNGVSLNRKIRSQLAACGPSMAFSLYSEVEAQHDAVTGARGSFRRTMESIEWCAAQGLRVRVAMISVAEDLSTMQTAEANLAKIGVKLVTYHRVQRVGRAAGAQTFSEIGPERCGMCGLGMICVTASGDVRECVFSRDRRIGRVGEGSYRGMIYPL